MKPPTWVTCRLAVFALPAILAVAVPPAHADSVYDAAADKKAADNPLFKEIVESQRAFAARAVKWDLDTNVSRRMAYNHYFAKAAPTPAEKKS